MLVELTRFSPPISHLLSLANSAQKCAGGGGDGVCFGGGVEASPKP